jgi:4-hydroxybenzoate polyprenyltransferase
MSHELIATLAVAATTGKTFHIGPWIIVPLLFLAALIGTPIYVIRDRRKRRSH